MNVNVFAGVNGKNTATALTMLKPVASVTSVSARHVVPAVVFAVQHGKRFATRPPMKRVAVAMPVYARRVASVAVSAGAGGKKNVTGRFMLKRVALVINAHARRVARANVPAAIGRAKPVMGRTMSKPAALAMRLAFAVRVANVNASAAIGRAKNAMGQRRPKRVARAMPVNVRRVVRAGAFAVAGGNRSGVATGLPMVTTAVNVTDFVSAVLVASANASAAIGQVGRVLALPTMKSVADVMRNVFVMPVAPVVAFVVNGRV